MLANGACVISAEIQVMFGVIAARLDDPLNSTLLFKFWPPG